MLVKIKNGKNKTYYYREVLRHKGFVFRKTGKYTGVWQKDCTEQESLKLVNYCKSRGLLCIVNEESFSRSNDYRKTFFNTNKGILKKEKYYQCVYCGKILKRKDVSVDHLFPIAKVKHKGLVKLNRKLLKMVHITNINQKGNLVPSCIRCNKKKGSKTGLWILRGLVGKYYIFWISVYLTIIILFLYALIHL